MAHIYTRYRHSTLRCGISPASWLVCRSGVCSAGRPAGELRAYASLLRYGAPDGWSPQPANGRSRGATMTLSFTRSTHPASKRRGGRLAPMQKLTGGCKLSVDRRKRDRHGPRIPQQQSGVAGRAGLAAPRTWIGLARVRREGGIRISAGENSGGLWEFRKCSKLRARWIMPSRA